jgi:hypothetical protein
LTKMMKMQLEKDKEDIYDMIYLTAVGLTPGSSSTSHIYTQTVHLHTNSKHNTEIGK